MPPASMLAATHASLMRREVGFKKLFLLYSEWVDTVITAINNLFYLQAAFRNFYQWFYLLLLSILISFHYSAFYLVFLFYPALF